MGAIERRSRQRKELRGLILAAARHVVLEDGYKALTMRRLAEAVEYSPAAIYQYFENRDAIAAALMNEGFDELAAAFDRLGPIADPRERLEAAGRAYVAFALDHPETYRLMFMDDPHMTSTLLSADPRPDSSAARAYFALIGPLSELKEQGRLRPEFEAQPVADAFWSALHGFVSLKLTCPSFPATPTETLVPTLVRSLFDGCLTP